MATKLYSKTNIDHSRKMTCHFIDKDVISMNYDAMKNYAKSVRFHKNLQF